MKNRKRVLDLINENYRIKDYIHKNNNEIILINRPIEFLLYNVLRFSSETYLLMFNLGIPIGIVESTKMDKHFKDIDNLFIDDTIKYIYFPISDIEEYYNYLSKEHHPDLIVNPNYMTDKEVINIAYCLELLSNDKIFEPFTKYKLQREILNSLPFKYENAMRIFNRYFDESVQRKIIYEYGISKEKFYNLSGLKVLVKSKNENIKDDIKYFSPSEHDIFGEIKFRKDSKGAYDNAIKRGLKNPSEWFYLYTYRDRDYFGNRITKKTKSYPQFGAIETIKRKINRER